MAKVNIAECWAQIEKWLSANAPDVVPMLPAGRSTKAFAQAEWFTRKWLPVLDAWTGDHICIDLDPPKGGKRGQLITWYHDNGPIEVLAASFGTLLAGFVTELEGGRYTPRVNQAGQP